MDDRIEGADRSRSIVLTRLGDLGAVSTLGGVLLILLGLVCMFVGMFGMGIGAMIDQAMNTQGMFTALFMFLGMAAYVVCLLGGMIASIFGMIFWVFAIVMAATMPLDQNDRLVWILVTVLGHAIGASIFWWVKARKWVAAGMPRELPLPTPERI